MQTENHPISDEEPLLLLEKEGATVAAPSSWSEQFGRLSANRRRAAVFVAAGCGLVALIGGFTESVTSYLPSILLGTASGANKIKVCVEEMRLTTPVKSRRAFVKCFDKDPNGDDVMAEDFTGHDGCVTMPYTKQSWDWIGGRSPDIYCTVEKGGFLMATPADKDHHDQNTLADFGTVTLWRDRSFDYGHDNGCGPAWTEWTRINNVAAFTTRFREQCTHHDKCYFDCQIYLAIGNADDAQEFCDREMYEGMKSYCHRNRGNLPGFGEDGCLSRAWTIYKGLQGAGGLFAYDKSNANCPEEGKSMNNDYSHPNCHVNGFECGFDGTVSDDLGECKNCCNGPEAIHRGKVWNDHYCKCFPPQHFCGSTLVGRRFNICNKCCHGSWRDDGWTYDNMYCK